MELTPAELQEILKVFVDSELRELQLQVGDVSLSVSKNDTGMAAAVPVAPNPGPAAAAPVESSPRPAEVDDGSSAAAPATAQAPPSDVDRSGWHALKSPVVGVFYRRPGPDQPPYVEVGDEVKVGDPVCTISVMKMFTEIGADRSGRIMEICVENETLVEHGQVLMYIDPADGS